MGNSLFNEILADPGAPDALYRQLSGIVTESGPHTISINGKDVQVHSESIDFREPQSFLAKFREAWLSS